MATQITTPFVRSIAFVVPGTSKAPDVQVLISENSGHLDFAVDVLSGPTKTADLRGLFFNLNDDSKLSGLTYSNGLLVTDFDVVDVIDLGHGANMHGIAKPFDVGVEFGTQGIGKDDIQSAAFTLNNGANPLTLDDLAKVDFGIRLTSVGVQGGLRSDSAKLTVVSPSAPDAHNDVYTIFEDGQSGLNAPSTLPEGTLFDLLANDTDGDGNTLSIVALRGVEHGTVTIVDGADADLLPGDAVLYTPFEDYSGSDSFEYAITDGHGGTDFARVDVDITAVADVPELSYEILEGGAVNQVIVRITTTQTDADSSEFMDRIELGGLPFDVTALPGGFNPGTEPDQIVQDFLLTLPQYNDSLFNLDITAYSKETSNADEQSAAVSTEIRYEYNLNPFDPTFEAEDQSMWGAGDAWSFHDDRFIGVDDNANGQLNASIGVGSAYANYDIDYKFGLQSTLDIGSGDVDASVPYSVDVQTLYNKSTDWLRFETAALLDINNSSFSTQSPLLEYTLKLIAELHTTLTFGANISIPGTPAVEVAGVTIIPAIPGWSWGDSTTVHPGFSASPTLLEFDGDSLNLFGLEGDSAASYDLGGGFSIQAMIPHFSTDSEVVGNHLESEGSANFLSLTADVDEMLALLLGIPNPFGQSVDFGPATLGYDILNYELTGSLGVGQEFFMTFGNLNGTLIFEDGAQQSFVVGNDFDVHDASSHDSNQDGVLDFSLELEPDATFSSNLLLTLELTHALALLDAYMSISVPVFDDPEFHLGPAYEYEDTLANTAIPIVGLPSFAFDLGTATETFMA